MNSDAVKAPSFPPSTPSGPAVISERDWRNLLRDIHSGQVIPVAGPELLVVTDPATGREMPLGQMIAPQLARRLGLRDPDSFSAVNETARAFLVEGGRRREIYEELREIIDALPPLTCAPLLELAGIRDFDFFIASTFDHLLASALEERRPSFACGTDLLAYHPRQPVDIPEPLRGTCLYHLLGDYNTYPDFAVWEEDYMEFVCGLIEHQDTLERLFRLLKKRHLLLLGAPASDWIVRFLLRVARQERLSDRTGSAAGEYLAERADRMEAPMVFFYDKMVHATRVVDGDPAAFVYELARRWRERYGHSGGDEDFLSRMPEAMPRDAVFISYAREDEGAAVRLARGLQSAGVPVWLDKNRIQAGENYETGLEAAVRVHCSFFLSLISENTERDTARQRYVHRERDWAASRHVSGFIFYVPVAVEDTLPEKWRPLSEPECFTHIHYHHMPGGAPAPAFVRHMRVLVETYRTSGRPRG